MYFPAEGYNWGDLKRYNADLRAEQSSLGWSEALAELRRAHGRLIEFVEGCSNAELYGGPMEGANNDWTPGRWAESAGPSHYYRSARKYVRGRIRDAK